MQIHFCSVTVSVYPDLFNHFKCLIYQIKQFQTQTFFAIYRLFHSISKCEIWETTGEEINSTAIALILFTRGLRFPNFMTDNYDFFHFHVWTSFLPTKNISRSVSPKCCLFHNCNIVLNTPSIVNRSHNLICDLF